MDKLSQYKLIASVDLIKSAEQQVSNVILKKFEIKCGIRADAGEGMSQ
jgi:hypothetical protein